MLKRISFMMLLMALMVILNTDVKAQFTQTKVEYTGTNTKIYSLVATVDSTTSGFSITSAPINFAELGKCTIYYGGLVTSALGNVSVTVKVYGSYFLWSDVTAAPGDSIATLFNGAARTSETAYSDTLSLSAMGPNYRYYYITATGNSGNQTDTKLYLNLLAKKD